MVQIKDYCKCKLHFDLHHSKCKLHLYLHNSKCKLHLPLAPFEVQIAHVICTSKAWLAPTRQWNCRKGSILVQIKISKCKWQVEFALVKVQVQVQVSLGMMQTQVQIEVPTQDKIAPLGFALRGFFLTSQCCFWGGGCRSFWGGWTGRFWGDSMPQFEGVCRPGIEGVSLHRLRPPPGRFFFPGEVLGSLMSRGVVCCAVLLASSETEKISQQCPHFVPQTRL